MSCGPKVSVLCEGSGEAGVWGAMALGLVYGLPAFCLAVAAVQVYWFLSNRRALLGLNRRLRARGVRMAADLEAVLEHLTAKLKEKGTGGNEKAGGREEAIEALGRFYGFKEG